MSDANKRLIRCAWEGTSAFASAGYGSNWGPGTCPASPSPPGAPPSPSPPLSPRAYTYTFTTKSSLQTAVKAYDTDPTAAIVTYGPIAKWDVSAITDMSYLFANVGWLIQP